MKNLKLDLFKTSLLALLVWISLSLHKISTNQASNKTQTFLPVSDPHCFIDTRTGELYLYKNGGYGLNGKLDKIELISEPVISKK
jgi:hypothetical protein